MEDIHVIACRISTHFIHPSRRGIEIQAKQIFKAPQLLVIVLRLIVETICFNGDNSRKLKF